MILTLVPSDNIAVLVNTDAEKVLEFDISGNAEVAALAAQLTGALATCPFRSVEGETFIQLRGSEVTEVIAEANAAAANIRARA